VPISKRAGEEPSEYAKVSGLKKTGNDTAPLSDIKKDAIKKTTQQPRRKDSKKVADDLMRPDADTEKQTARPDTYRRSAPVSDKKSGTPEKTTRQARQNEKKEVADDMTRPDADTDTQVIRRGADRHSEMKESVNRAGGKETKAMLKKNDRTDPPGIKILTKDEKQNVDKKISAAGKEIRPGPPLEKPRVDVPDVR
jgi:hypothetical protein